MVSYDKKSTTFSSNGDFWYCLAVSAATPPNMTNEELFAKAQKHMEGPENTDIRSIVTLTKKDTRIRWNKEGNKVELVAFVEGTTKFPSKGRTILSSNIWSFSEKEVEDWYAANKNRMGTDKRMRLLQLTGLSPKAKENRFVIFLVDPIDVMRPANVTDPKIDRMEARRPTTGVQSHSENNTFNIKQIQLDPTKHRRAERVATRLGYSYDWGLINGQYGLTEFMVAPFVEVTVLGSYSWQEYLTKLGNK